MGGSRATTPPGRPPGAVPYANVGWESLELPGLLVQTEIYLNRSCIPLTGGVFDVRVVFTTPMLEN